jgi:hypothetical protein
MVQGVTLLDSELGMPRPRGLFEITEVCFSIGGEPQLRVEIKGEGWIGLIIFDAPASHRVQDERDLLTYWQARDSERVPVGTAYEIRESAYLDEMSKSVSGMETRLLHYLFAGRDICVEVIAAEGPRVVLKQVR